MDISGNNRYELLFVDDDSAAPQKHAESAAPKKKQQTAPTSVKKSPGNVKKNGTEKENKSSALNRNEVVGKKPGYELKAKSETTPSITLNKNRGNEVASRRTAFKPQNGEIREKTGFRRNFREGGEFGNEQREPRQFKERDGRGPPRNREPFRGGKREFDRQSGSDKTGVKAVDKRDGAGAHNWGSVKQEIEDINKPNADAEVADKEESSNEQTVEQPTPEEEEVKEFTLDEWKALRGERIKPQYNIRKPNEGEDTSQWKKMVVLNKKKEGDSEEEFEFDPAMYPQRVGRLQRIVDIQFNFNDGRRGGGSGFGRGRGRGPRPGGPGGDNKGTRTEGDRGDRGDRQPRQQRNVGERKQKRDTANALKVDDERQFPTLN